MLLTGESLGDSVAAMGDEGKGALCGRSVAPAVSAAAT